MGQVMFQVLWLPQKGGYSRVVYHAKRQGKQAVKARLCHANDIHRECFTAESIHKCISKYY